MCLRKHQNASITAEASLIMPVFIFALLMFVYLFMFIEVSLELHNKSLELGRNISSMAALQGSAEQMKESMAQRTGLSGTAINNILNAAGGVSMGAAFTDIKDRYGAVLADLSFEGTAITPDKDCIVIVCSASIRPPISMFGLVELRVRQRVKIRLFNGCCRELIADREGESKEDGANEQRVYVTETGSVYHESMECTHLKLSVRSVDSAVVGALRNNNGAKYYACEKCVSGKTPETVYITGEGNRYHTAVSCSGLKRTVTQIAMSKAKLKYRPCSRCAKKMEQN